jgi:hypothetical protein
LERKYEPWSDPDLRMDGLVGRVYGHAHSPPSSIITHNNSRFHISGSPALHISPWDPKHLITLHSDSRVNEELIPWLILIHSLQSPISLLHADEEGRPRKVRDHYHDSTQDLSFLITLIRAEES